MAIARRTDVEEAVDSEVAEAKVAGWAVVGTEADSEAGSVVEGLVVVGSAEDLEEAG